MNDFGYSVYIFLGFQQGRLAPSAVYDFFKGRSGPTYPKLDGIWSSKGLTPDSIQFYLVVPATFTWIESRVNPSFPLPVSWKSCDLDFVCFACQLPCFRA